MRFLPIIDYTMPRVLYNIVRYCTVYRDCTVLYGSCIVTVICKIMLYIVPYQTAYNGFVHGPVISITRSSHRYRV